MWFRFPDGVDQITVEQMNYKTEIEQDNVSFFRAHDHFAPIILSLPGFMAQRPKGDDLPEDLAPTLPGAKGAVDNLVDQVTALKEEIAGLRAVISDLTNERDKAVKALTPLADENARLKAEKKAA